MTYPVEDIDGVMVAQTNTEAQIEGGSWKGGFLEGIAGQVHPVRVEKDVAAAVEKVRASLDEHLAAIFGQHAAALRPLDRMLIDESRWSFRADAIYVNVAERLARNEVAPDLVLIYLGGTDVVGHRFWRYHQPGAFRYPPSEEELELFGSTVRDYVLWADAAIGRLRSAFGEDATTIIVSDHGMHVANPSLRVDRENPPRRVVSGDHQDAPPGVLIAGGARIRRPQSEPELAGLRKRQLERVAHVLDVCPTVLALCGLPAANDMAGEARFELLEEGLADSLPERVATYDDEGFRARQTRDADRQAAGAEERMEQLRTLGYLGD